MGKFTGINADPNPHPTGSVRYPINDGNPINDAPQAPPAAWVNPIDGYQYNDKY